MYMPPCSGKRAESRAMTMAEGRKKKSAAMIHKRNEPGPACAAAATQRKLTMAQMLKKTRSRRRSSRRGVSIYQPGYNDLRIIGAFVDGSQQVVLLAPYQAGNSDSLLFHGHRFPRLRLLSDSLAVLVQALLPIAQDVESVSFRSQSPMNGPGIFGLAAMFENLPGQLLGAFQGC